MCIHGWGFKPLAIGKPALKRRHWYGFGPLDIEFPRRLAAGIGGLRARHTPLGCFSSRRRPRDCLRSICSAHRAYEAKPRLARPRKLAPPIKLSI